MLANKTIAVDRMAILTRRRTAEELGNEQAVAECDGELATLNGPKLKYGTSLSRDDHASSVAAVEMSQQQRLAELNRQNRKKNAEDVRKAQLAEKKAARLAREAAQRGDAVHEDPMARVKTMSKTRYDVNQSLATHRVKEAGSISQPTTPVLNATHKSPQIVPKSAKSNGLPVLGSRRLEEDVIGAMDLGIDIEI